MTRNGKGSKRGRIDYPFSPIAQRLMDSAAYRGLSPYAVKLMIDLLAQYRGSNNGDLSAAWKLMKPRGWRSPETLQNAKRELIAAGIVFETRKGRLPNTCSLYALTWLPLDESAKHDHGRAAFTRWDFTTREPLNAKPAREELYRRWDGAAPGGGASTPALATPAVVEDTS